MQGDQLIARARVVRLDSGRMLPEIESSGPLTDLFAVFGRLAQQIRGVPSAPPPVATDRLPPSPQVFELYVKGLIAETPSTALAFLEQALKAAPQFDRVRLAIWDLHSDASEHQRALDAVSAINPASRFSREGRFRRSLSLMNLKRFDEALETLRAMQKEDPSATVANALGVVELRRTATPQPGRRPITSARPPSSIRRRRSVLQPWLCALDRQRRQGRDLLAARSGRRDPATVMRISFSAWR